MPPFQDAWLTYVDISWTVWQFAPHPGECAGGGVPGLRAASPYGANKKWVCHFCGYLVGGGSRNMFFCGYPFRGVWPRIKGVWLFSGKPKAKEQHPNHGKPMSQRPCVRLVNSDISLWTMSPVGTDVQSPEPVRWFINYSLAEFMDFKTCWVDHVIGKQHKLGASWASSLAK